MNIEDLANYFASVSISFENAIQQVMEPRTKNIEKYHECASIIIISSGLARFTINETSYKLKTGSVLHVGPSTVISEEVLSDTKCSYILIQYRILENEVGIFPLYTSHFIMNIDNQKKVFQYAMELVENFRSTDVYMKLKCKSLLLSFIVELIHALKNDSKKQPAIDLEKIKGYIHQHYAEPITINEIASNFGIKRRYLTSIFQRYIGLSPIEYLTAYRIHKAQELLLLTDKQIIEISNSVGYVDNLYFSRVFKKKTGMSPTEYRKYRSFLTKEKVNQD